jgi:hypothetical protein
MKSSPMVQAPVLPSVRVWTTSFWSTHSMSTFGSISRPGIRPSWVAIAAAVCELVPIVPDPSVRWTIVARAMSRAASDVPFIM